VAPTLPCFDAVDCVPDAYEGDQPWHVVAGADLTNSVIDRVVLDNANLEGAQLVNAVITGGYKSLGAGACSVLFVGCCIWWVVRNTAMLR
jgi:hypothetical protein